MNKSTTKSYNASNEDHPAFAAWKQLGLSQAQPRRIELLKDQRGHSHKRNVYRLHLIDPECTVIAKICGKKSGLREQTIYEQILRHLPLSSPRFYGSVAKNDSCWIFLEDIQGKKYSLNDITHRNLAATWLGFMHTLTEQFAEKVSLPNRDPEYYKNQSKIAQNAIICYLDNKVLGMNERMVLQKILSHLDVMKSLWYKIEIFCKDMPRTLIHGDLVTKNVQIRQAYPHSFFMPFDWGTTAGWGPPAVDLTQFVGRAISPELRVYHDIVCKNWSHLQFSDINRLAEIGKIFRLVLSVKWASESLVYEWVEDIMNNMRIYENDLRDVIRAEGLEY